MYRSSTGNLGEYDDNPRRSTERWDRDRFERMSRRGGGGGGGPDEHEHFRFQEHDRYPGGRRDIDIHQDFDRRRPSAPVMERPPPLPSRFFDDERSERPSRRRDDIFENPTPSEVANRALAPYRRKSVIERDVEVAPRRPARPQYIRRQSSLDTFDRRPLPRYHGQEHEHEHERDEWRPPTNVPIPLPIRERRRSPPQRFREDDDFSEISYRDSSRDPRREREEYREVEVKREKSVRRRSRSKAARSRAPSSHSSSTSSFEEIQPVRATWGKKGRTKLPRRLCKKEAVIDLGYPFEEEDDFIIVQRALEKDHIDEIIKTSESYSSEKVTYVYEDPEPPALPAPPPPESVAPPPPASVAPPPPASVAPPPPASVAPPPPASVAPAPPPPPPPESVAPPPPPTVIHAPPPPPSIAHSVHTHYTAHGPPPPPSVYSHSVRSSSPSRHHHTFEERIEESNHIGGPLTVLVPDERRLVRVDREYRSERDIKEEIRALETERRMLKYEREGDYEIVERRDRPREVIRVDKDRKVRDKPNPKLVAAMMATLT